MDDVDKRIMNLIQEDFPIAAEPFRLIGEQLGLDAGEVLERIGRLKEKGIIRRIGAVFDPKKLGFASALCAARVPEEQVRSFVNVVNALPGVTHNYRRDHDYNVWFTLIAPGEEALAVALAGIKVATGVSDILSLHAVKTFKINAKFEV